MFEGQCKWNVSSFEPGQILDMMPGGLCIYHVDDDQFTYVSKNMLNMLGYTEETFREKFDNRFSELVYIEDREATLSTIVDQITGNEYDTCIYRIEKSDGSLMWVKDEGHLVTDPDGRECFCVTLVDVTALQERQENNLEQQENDYNDTIQELLVANPNARSAYKLNLTQNTCSDCHGATEYIQNLVDAATVDDMLRRVTSVMMDDYSIRWYIANVSREQLLAKYQRGERRFTISYRHLRDNGGPVWVKTFYHMIENPKTHDIEVVVYTIDVDREYKEEKILTKIVEQSYDCFGLLDVNTDEVEYFYGNNEVDSFDKEKIVKKLEGQTVYSYSKTEGKKKKQVNFFYFDETREQIVFSQVDVTETHLRDSENKYLRVRETVSDILGRDEGEDKVKSLMKIGKTGTFFLFDIDDFKILNDTFGSRASDRILQNFANYIEGQFRTNDIVFRVIKDKFAVFAMGIEKQSKIIKKVEQIYEGLGEVCLEDQPDLMITISIGIHIHQDPEEIYDDMYQAADEQLHIAKKDGKDTFCIG